MAPPQTTPLPEDPLERTWQELLTRQGQLKTDRKLAELALELIRELGNGTAQRQLLRILVAAWVHDWELTLGAASLLIEQAGHRGMDEPIVSEETPARWASDALRQALEGLEPSKRRDPDIAGNLHATLGNALRLRGPGHDAAAQEAFGRALELDEERGSWWYDSGLLHKWRGRFEAGLRANEMARDHGAHRRPTLWNLAICATGLGQGEVASGAWSELGMPAKTDPNTSMPFVEGLPPLLVRVLSRPSAMDGTSDLSAGVGFELVWVAPLSPCHGVVQSPTFRDAPIDYGDLILWDGAPTAEHRLSSTDSVPVFPLLEILAQGDERRWPFVAIETKPGGVQGVEDALPPGTRVFVQQERVTHHCPACEAGVPHDHEGEPVSAPVSAPVFLRGKIIVPSSVDLSSFREAWETAVRGQALSASLPGLYESLGDTKRAGQEHQAWRGIERKALRQKADR